MTGDRVIEPASEAQRRLVERDAAAFFHQDGSSPCLGALRHAEGIHIEDLDGRRFIDLHGNTVHHLGHAHPELVAALRDQLEHLSFSPRRFTNAPATELAERLLAHWPGAPARVLFATGGSDAIEIALKLARVATGRPGTVSIEGSYHGHGFGAFGLSRAVPDARLGGFLTDRHHVTPYWRADLGGPERMLDDLRRVLATDGDRIGAFVAEAMRSNCHVPPGGLWPEVRRLCDRHGVVLVFDEIPSGLGKTGRFFSFEHFGVVPDIAVLGKALGGGLLPIAAVIADARFDVAPDLNLGHYTHEKNPLTTRVALEMLRIVDRDDLPGRAARLETHVRAEIGERSRESTLIAGVRGLGLQLAITLDAAALARDPVLAERLVTAAFACGVSTTTKGTDAVGFSPPLVIDEAGIADAIDRLFRAAAAVCPPVG